MTLQRERRADGVEVLRIDRPQQRNALDTATLVRLNQALDELSQDPALRVLVLSTTSVDGFCAGADVGEVLDVAGGVARMEAFTELYRRVELVPVPTIAVCVGSCVGAGAEIVTGCDLRVGGDNLRLAWAGARLGVPVGPARLTQLVGLGRAKDLVYTGRPVDADRALALGLVGEVVPAAEAEAAAVTLAERLVRQSPEGLRQLKAMFRDLEGTEARIAHENELLMDFQRHGAGLPQG
ncbi:MAG: enoyl-CoA hydratase/isomerase family protein [Nocardioides sp.]|nr:enoyl-CoA hydratase/isomerase family protein [Nocardioides sp.]